MSANTQTVAQCHPIVAFHSSQSSGRQWRALANELKATTSFELSAPDLIGYGKNPSFDTLKIADEAFHLQHEKEALLRGGFIKPPFIAFGHSYGGALALHWARTKPEQVQALILYEPVAFHVLPAGDAARTEILTVAEKLLEVEAAEGCAHFVDYWNQAGYFKALPEPVQQGMIQQQAKVTADFHALLNEPAQLTDYQKLTCPVVIFKGKQSPLSSRRVADLLYENIDQAKMIEVEAGHMGPLTHPSLVVPLWVDAVLKLLKL